MSPGPSSSAPPPAGPRPTGSSPSEQTAEAAPPLALVMPDSVRATILAHARAAYPSEACGLLVGWSGPNGLLFTAEAHPTQNISEGNRRDRFEVDPSAHVALARRLRGGSSRIIGHFHSHPDHRPDPSKTDMAAIMDAKAVWVIVGLNGRDAATTSITAWSVRDWNPERARGRFRPLAIVGQHDIPPPRGHAPERSARKDLSSDPDCGDPPPST